MHCNRGAMCRCSQHRAAHWAGATSWACHRARRPRHARPSTETTWMCRSCWKSSCWASGATRESSRCASEGRCHARHGSRAGWRWAETSRTRPTHRCCTRKCRLWSSWTSRELTGLSRIRHLCKIDTHKRGRRIVGTNKRAFLQHVEARLNCHDRKSMYAYIKSRNTWQT